MIKLKDLVKNTQGIDLCVGMIIVLSNNQKILIGDANELGGVCDDCCYYVEDDISIKFVDNIKNYGFHEIGDEIQKDPLQEWINSHPVEWESIKKEYKDLDVVNLNIKTNKTLSFEELKDLNDYRYIYTFNISLYA